MSNIDLTCVLVISCILHKTYTADELPLAPHVSPGIGTDPTIDAATPIMEEFINQTSRTEGRIIGGQPTHIKDFPYLVQISLRDNHICGGSYIKRSWVLTAAHCLRYISKKYPFTCSMGITFLYDDDSDVQTRIAQKAIKHEYYFPDNDTNDVGLLMLEKPFTLGMKVSIIPLARRPFSDYSISCKVAGWGVTREEDIDDRTKLSEQLRYVRIPVIEQNECRRIFYPKNFEKHFMGDQVFCAGFVEGGYDACQGDSGGPFICSDAQVGIVSWGLGCGNEVPGVYVNVTSYLDWIDYTIWTNQRKHSRRSANAMHLQLNYFCLVFLYISIVINNLK